MLDNMRSKSRNCTLKSPDVVFFLRGGGGCGGMLHEMDRAAFLVVSVIDQPADRFRTLQVRF